MNDELAVDYKEIPDFETKPDGLFEQLLKRWVANKFDVNNPPEETLPFLSIKGIPVSTRGNLTAITAQVKSGKTAYVGAIRSALMAEDASGKDFLGIEAGAIGSDGIVVHLDTEQGREDYFSVGCRDLKRAGIAKLPEWLDSSLVRDWTPAEIRKFLPHRLEWWKNRGKKIEALIVDGVADLANDTNSLTESKELVSWLLKIAQDYQCAVIGVIHQNHGSEGGKATGHLGTQLEKKAETVIKLSKNEEIVTVSAPVTRRAPISAEYGPQFVFNDEVGMHVSIADKYTATSEARENIEKEILKQLYQHGDFTIQKSRMEIKKAFQAHFDFSEASAEKLMKKMTGKQWLVKGYVRGQWILSNALQVEFNPNSQ